MSESADPAPPMRPMPPMPASTATCPAEGPCLTCGDVAIPLTVVAPAPDGGLEADVLCRDDQGRPETVATELVGPVGVGDRLLVHAGVAIEVLGRAAAARPGGDGTESGGRDAVRR